MNYSEVALSQKGRGTFWGQGQGELRQHSPDMNQRQRKRFRIATSQNLPRYIPQGQRNIYLVSQHPASMVRANKELSFGWIVLICVTLGLGLSFILPHILIQASITLVHLLKRRWLVFWFLKTQETRELQFQPTISTCMYETTKYLHSSEQKSSKAFI